MSQQKEVRFMSKKGEKCFTVKGVPKVKTAVPKEVKERIKTGLEPKVQKQKQVVEKKPKTSLDALAPFVVDF
jgi:hypothetical protein